MISIDTTLVNHNNRIIELQHIKARINRDIAKFPPGNLRIMKQGTNTQYFLITKTGDTKGKYISKTKMQFIKELAQKDYLQKALKLIDKELRQLRSFTRHYNPVNLEMLHTRFKTERQELITPIILTSKEYATQWQAITYTGKSIASNEAPLYTSKGEQVRSKSEIIIADTLTRLDIPYRYEFPLKLTVSDLKSNANNRHSRQSQNNQRTITFHPDFTCLNKRTRQEFIWEHLGMMDSPEYAKPAIERERIYVAAGYIPGINFIATTETTELPLNSKYVEQIARKLLL